ncbi:Glycosyltransferase involved in cell wall bisynthesis [Burkholderia sp. GAS332]|uniref:glycosyltransferase n=1 Tax=Paraburkholderia sediminicola TaxID=458836 RepID=UPI000929DB19|nr:Glycosyltransferase involved in cell wall bisynthesis [Burkholderia sp. GAS332]
MRILHVIASAHPRSGGPIEALTRLSAHLKTVGHRLDVVCLDPAGAGADDGAFGSVVRLGHRGGKYSLNVRLVPWLKTAARDYDAVVVNGLWQFHGLAVLFALRGQGIPYFVVPHGMMDPWFNKAYPGKWVKKLAYWMLVERHLLKGAQNVIFTSESERVLAQSAFPFYKSREAVMVYGTAPPPTDYAQPGEGEQANRALENEDGERKNIILYIGRIHEKKGCDLLIRAYSDLGSECKNYRVVIAGPDDNALAGMLKMRAEELSIGSGISWPGMVTGAVKWSLMRSADVLVLPSHQENFGVSVAEALGCGVPVLITKKVAIWEEVVADQAGFADSDDQAGVSRLLRKWASTPAATKAAMRFNALACFNNRFHIERVAQSYVDIVGRTAMTRGSLQHDQAATD